MSKKKKKPKALESIEKYAKENKMTKTKIGNSFHFAKEGEKPPKTISIKEFWEM